MSTFVIGDVQGCYDQLVKLLTTIHFEPEKDTLWFTGDLVNRGPKSLEVLRFVCNLPSAITVLGNHDLTLLALAYTDLSITNHTLDAILAAHDREELLTWLRHQPLIYEDKTFNTVLVHAGIPPQWTLSQAKLHAAEVELCLRSDQFKELLRHLFGNSPNFWEPTLTGWDRYRFIINALTRMRFCDAHGRIDLTYKGDLASAPAHLKPWYKVMQRTNNDPVVLFGHWAALTGEVDVPCATGLDTGCYWGGTLTALRLEDRKRFTVSCG